MWRMPKQAEGPALSEESYLHLKQGRWTALPPFVLSIKMPTVSNAGTADKRKLLNLVATTLWRAIEQWDMMSKLPAHRRFSINILMMMMMTTTMTMMMKESPLYKLMVHCFLGISLTTGWPLWSLHLRHFKRKKWIKYHCLVIKKIIA